MIRAIVFDVGETLLDERGLWSRWADWIGVPRDDFMTALSNVISRGEHHRKVFEVFRPNFDLTAATEALRAIGDDAGFRVEDFHADALPCLARLKEAGLRIGIVGNTSATTERFLARSGVPADFIGSSAAWNIEKPLPLFFARVVREAGAAPNEIAYVGDRLDNDVLPAMQAGLAGVFLRRGLWAAVHRHWPQASGVDLTIDTLSELPSALANLPRKHAGP